MHINETSQILVMSHQQLRQKPAECMKPFTVYHFLSDLHVFHILVGMEIKCFQMKKYLSTKI